MLSSNFVDYYVECPAGTSCAVISTPIPTCVRVEEICCGINNEYGCVMYPLNNSVAQISDPNTIILFRVYINWISFRCKWGSPSNSKGEVVRHEESFIYNKEQFTLHKVRSKTIKEYPKYEYVDVLNKCDIKFNTIAIKMLEESINGLLNVQEARHR